MQLRALNVATYSIRKVKDFVALAKSAMKSFARNASQIATNADRFDAMMIIAVWNGASTARITFVVAWWIVGDVARKFAMVVLSLWVHLNGNAVKDAATTMYQVAGIGASKNNSDLWLQHSNQCNFLINLMSRNFIT